MYSCLCLCMGRDKLVANVALKVLQVTRLEESPFGFALANRDRLQVDGHVRDKHLIGGLGSRKPKLWRSGPRGQRQVLLMLAIVVDCVVIAYRWRKLRPLGADFLRCRWRQRRRRSSSQAVLRWWNVGLGS